MPQNQESDLGNTEDQPNTNSDLDKIAKAEKPPFTFDELMSTPIDFSAYIMNNLKVDNLTQDILIGPAFNLLKGTCKSHRELEYNFEEYRGHQVVPVDYFLNNDLEYLNDGSSSRKYKTSTTKTKAAKYDNIQSMKTLFHRYGVRNQSASYEVSKKKLSNLDRDVLFDFGVALQMFTRRIIILHRVEDLQLGNIIKLETYRLMCSDELFKFNDGMLTSVRTVLHDIASNLRMDYLPKRRWSNLDRQRYHIMIKAIDKLQLERRLMRSLEKFVGGSDYGIDLRLLERII
ncbi:hypothetical protein Tco_1307661 [Tanacetum coccineum]